MNNAEDTLSRRQKRTREHLKQALIELIKEKGYHSVTVKDIVDYAAYNRSTFYVHYLDKMDLAEDLLDGMFEGLEASLARPYKFIRKINTSKLNESYFNIVNYIYKNRNFFELINEDDTIPGLHLGFPQTILKIYRERFTFETINDIPVNMNYFKHYTAYGFFGLLQNWIQNGFKEGQEEFIQEVIDLSKTHIHSVKYIGKS